MSIFYRIVIVLLILAASYSLFGIVHFKWMRHSVDNPKAVFQITGNQKASVTLVEFINYTCGYCKELHPTVEEALDIRKDIRYIVRPVVFDEDTAEKITHIVMAAGFQKKFWEMHKAVLEYPEIEIPDDFIQETALLYGLDYDLLIKDSQSKKVKKLVQNNLAAFEHAGARSVPSFMIQGQIFMVTNEGLPDLKQLLTMISNATKS